MNPVESDHVLMAHRARTERVNRTRWRYESPADERGPAAGTIGERARRRAGVALIHAGERLLSPRPVPVLPDCEPQPVAGG